LEAEVVGASVVAAVVVEVVSLLGQFLLGQVPRQVASQIPYLTELQLHVRETGQLLLR